MALSLTHLLLFCFSCVFPQANTHAWIASKRHRKVINMVTFYLISLLPFRRLGSLHFRRRTQRMRNVPHCRVRASASECERVKECTRNVCSIFLCHLPFAFAFRLRLYEWRRKGTTKSNVGQANF